MKYFFDTEFSEFTKKPFFGKQRHHLQFVSIGIVAEDGREYYAVSKEFDLKQAWENVWLRENVLLKIYEDFLSKERYAREYHCKLVKPFSLKTLQTLIRWNGKTKKQIAQDIITFVNEGQNLWTSLNSSQIAPDNTEFYAYYADYDWVMFCSLFGTMMDLPKGFPMYCRDLKQTLDEKLAAKYMTYLPPCPNQPEIKSNDNIPLENKLVWAKSFGNYPAQINEHHALYDAKWNFELYKFLHRHFS